MRLALAVSLLAISACTTSLPEIKHPKFAFPDNAYVSDVRRPYDKLGLVKSRVDFPTLDPNREEGDLCNNYYNKGVRDLVKRAKKVGADAVIQIRSVVFMEDGHVETYPTPECADEGEEGQILLEGIAIKWKPTPVASDVPLDFR
jgi:hypothetical protein